MQGDRSGRGGSRSGPIYDRKHSEQCVPVREKAVYKPGSHISILPGVFGVHNLIFKHHHITYGIGHLFPRPYFRC